VQHELRAHAVLAIQKSCHLHVGSGLHPRELRRGVSQRDAIHLALDLPLVAAFDLQRAVRELEVQERESGRRVPQRFDPGKLAGQRNRVEVHLLTI